MGRATPIAKIAIASPLRTLFDYRLPDAFSGDGDATVGLRVKVPFGRRQVIGMVVAIADHSAVATDKLRTIEVFIDQQPLLPAPLLALFLWAARYYQHPLGDALFHALPSLLRRGDALPDLRQTQWQLTDKGRGLAPNALGKAPRQRALIDRLLGEQAVDDAALAAQFSRAIIRLLESRELIAAHQVDASAATHPNPQVLRETPLVLGAEQQRAMAQIELTGFRCWLLNGITGSGKTEIYLQCIEQVLNAGRQALVLIPEISLTPQTKRRFTERFAVPLVVLHSGMTDKQRLAAWTRARNGEARIVLGTRSAIFTPLAAPGLIVVDEEQDGSYKQQDGFRYSARDLAVMRAQRENTPIILGSATPSLESLYNCELGRYSALYLNARAGSAKPAGWQVVDMRDQSAPEGIASTTLEAIEQTLKRSEQVLVFLNRRGFAPAVLCHSCGWVAECRDCDARMTLHRGRNRIICHHCDKQLPPPQHCPSCRSTQLVATGEGTERSELLLQKQFPKVQVLRVDRDSTRVRGHMQQVFDTANSGVPCILIGTQMLAKGHHFDRVTLVVVVDGDSGLLSPDFRAGERMGQLLTQVAGRSGRSDLPGRVLLQTHQPDHPSLVLLLEQGYRAFAEQLLAHRKTQQLPPYRHLTLIRAESKDPQRAEKFLRIARQSAAELLPPTPQLGYLGPLPALMERRAGRYRYVLRIEAEQRTTLHQLLSRLMPVLERHQDPRHLRWSVDVDAQEL